MAKRKNKNGLLIDTAQALTVSQALRSFTIDAAHGCGMEADRGSLEPGKRADLAVLTDNPLTIPASQLKDVTSAVTVAAGKIAWSGTPGRAGNSRCPGKCTPGPLAAQRAGTGFPQELQLAVELNALRWSSTSLSPTAA